MTAVTYRFRVKDKHAARLARQAKAVHAVWNYCRETHEAAVRWARRWPTWHDLQKLTAGSSEALGLHSHTIQQVCQRYAQSRDQQRKPFLRWRGRRSLGWVPFNNGHVRFDGSGFVFNGIRFEAWLSRPLASGQRFGAGSFSQDSLGRWFINLPVELTLEPSAGTGAIGIDLGLKDIAALSDGRKIEHPRWYRAIEARLAVAQRARKKRQIKRLHATAAAQRADFLHKESTRIVREHGAVFVGNVRPSSIAKTRMAKSSLDAGWGMFKQKLEYKAIARGVLFREVNEAFSTQTCSRCASVEGPQGLAGLRIRQWTCSCGAVHDRDTNSAQIIVRRGLAALEAGVAK